VIPSRTCIIPPLHRCGCTNHHCRCRWPHNGQATWSMPWPHSSRSWVVTTKFKDLVNSHGSWASGHRSCKRQSIMFSVMALQWGWYLFDCDDISLEMFGSISELSHWWQYHQPSAYQWGTMVQPVPGMTPSMSSLNSLVLAWCGRSESSQMIRWSSQCQLLRVGEPADQWTWRWGLSD